jgi:hypothetical protein
LKFLLLTTIICFQNYSYSQFAPADSLKTDSLRFRPGKVKKQTDHLHGQYDIGDLASNIFHPNRKTDSLRKRSGITIIPNIAANPSIGFQIGIKAVAGINLGADARTFMSVAGTSATVTTKGILNFYLTHNVFTNGNKWNLQGSVVATKSVIPDYGFGIGRSAGGSEEDKVLTNPGRKGYVLHSMYYNFREKVYKEIFENFFIGGGISFDIRSRIEDRATAINELTPYTIYNNRYGFDRDNYRSNGLLFSTQYTTRDNQNRAYKGIFADVNFKVNQSWMGSTKNALQFTADFRKYISLSNQNPEHVLALWNWGSHLISGALPYLELPGTGKDPAARSGRGYTVGYFKGTQYYYSEAEYRFPITKNKFLSAVTFFNIQTANDGLGTRLFQQWQPGGGGGLRVLFNKATRTNLCLDYAFGKFGARGFFLGINEAF